MPEETLMLHVWRYYITRNLEAERERWVLWLPVLFATGIGIYFALPQEPSMWLTLAVIELTLLAGAASGEAVMAVGRLGCYVGRFYQYSA